eukprot:6202135-Pleurochrysis_carterae.AAC.2
MWLLVTMLVTELLGLISGGVLSVEDFESGVRAARSAGLSSNPREAGEQQLTLDVVTLPRRHETAEQIPLTGQAME